MVESVERRGRVISVFLRSLLTTWSRGSGSVEKEELIWTGGRLHGYDMQVDAFKLRQRRMARGAVAGRRLVRLTDAEGGRACPRQ